MNRPLQKYVWFLLPLLLIIFSLRVYCEIGQKSVTIDEFAYLPAGYYYLKTGDFDLYRILPPLIPMLCATPLLSRDVNFRSGMSWEQINKWDFGYEFMLSNAQSYQDLFETSRLVILGLSMLLGLLIFCWAKELFGMAAGYFALFMYTFNPGILAHSGLVTLDIGVSLFIFVTIYFFWKFIKSGKMLYYILSGATSGIAIVSKYSALMVVPIILIIGLSIVTLRLKLTASLTVKKILILLAILFLMSLLVINAIYFFKGSFIPLGKFEFQSGLFKSFNNSFLSALPAPFPYDFLKGFDEQLSIQGGKFDSYLNGTMSDSSWWYYYIEAFLIKEPISWILLLLIASIMNIIHRRINDEMLLFILMPPILFLIVVSSMSVNIGLRYLLPAYPFLIVFSSSIINETLFKKLAPFRFVRLVVVICSLWYFISSAMIHPHYLAYFNELAGGPGKGYKYLVDSNIDWGQDLIGLKSYLLDKRIDRIYLAYFGRVDPQLYGIEFDLLPNQPVKGYCAISASYLAGRPYFLYKDMKLHLTSPYFYRWLSDFRPIDNIGYSIYIYKFE